MTEKPIDTTFETHYRVADLAKMWSVSVTTVRTLLAGEPGIMRIPGQGGGKRAHVTVSVPASVAQRIHSRLCDQPLEKPLRIVRLRDDYPRVRQTLRHVLK